MLNQRLTPQITSYDTCLLWFSTLSCAHENVHQWSPLMIRYTKDSKRSVLSLVILAVQPNSRKYHALVPNIPETENVHQWSPLFTSDLPWWHMLYLLCNQIRGSTMLLYLIFQRLKMFTSDLPCSPVPDLPWWHMLYLLCNQIRGSTMLLYQIFQRLKMFTKWSPLMPYELAPSTWLSAIEYFGFDGSERCTVSVSL